MLRRAVRMLVQFYGRTPDRVTEEELQEYFLHLKKANKWSPNTMRICCCGIRSLFENVLRRDWHLLGILRAQNGRRLPSVLSVEEVRRLLGEVKAVQNHTFFQKSRRCSFMQWAVKTGSLAESRWWRRSLRSTLR